MVGGVQRYWTPFSCVRSVLRRLDPFNISPMSNEVTTFSNANRFDLEPFKLESYKQVAHEESKNEECVEEDFQRSALC